MIMKYLQDVSSSLNAHVKYIDICTYKYIAH